MSKMRPHRRLHGCGDLIDDVSEKLVILVDGVKSDAMALHQYARNVTMEDAGVLMPLTRRKEVSPRAGCTA